MNKQVLSPFDCDMCAMIEDITKQEIEVTASDTSIRLSWAQNGSEGNDKAEGQRIEALKQPGISGKWKARPGMFGNKGNERGNGIQQPPWNATLFSLLKW